LKIAIFHTAQDKKTALAIGSIIAAHSVPVAYQDIDILWDHKRTKNPLAIMESVSHFLFVFSSDMTDLSTFIFFAGYCLGKGISVIVLETDGNFDLPENVRHLGVKLRPESFEGFFVAEKERFASSERKAMARRALLDQGISFFDENFVSVLQADDPESVRLFLEAGYDPDFKDLRGIPALSHAVRAHSRVCTLLLLSTGADIDCVSDDRGYTPLMDAVQAGDDEMASLLLDHNANVNQRSKDGQTALVLGAGRGAVEICALLIRRGADPAIKDNLGMSALGYAQLFKNQKLMELFNTGPA